ncbi:hypothetical protein Pve01_01740 [Planomonospora venezuelensis]|nr:hypothetical protein Pve01_01740 [Planomonospora venezuelensis]
MGTDFPIGRAKVRISTSAGSVKEGGRRGTLVGTAECPAAGAERPLEIIPLMPDQISRSPDTVATTAPTRASRWVR